ncbi:hypothetical protein OH720_06460 [Pseudomonas sp. WJP1]|uniref:hypothetical protein n=1 Tax=Pseudomonas sp. WJP1 TaxID=2986947 RepID=UPI00234ADE11|nr:hypothetical protein [Pseudomonas sp. WJP1]WCM52654.1 hypothetical protein OH720_06460 [Pseudomonas sp. WJP1]
MFHRRSPQQAPDAHCIRMAPTRSLKQDLMLRQLFISGAVAACNMEVKIALSQKRCLQGLFAFDVCGQYISAARFTRIHLNSIR